MPKQDEGGEMSLCNDSTKAYTLVVPQQAFGAIGASEEQGGKTAMHAWERRAWKYD
jgi:hypothetical protein